MSDQEYDDLRARLKKTGQLTPVMDALIDGVRNLHRKLDAYRDIKAPHRADGKSLRIRLPVTFTVYPGKEE